MVILLPVPAYITEYKAVPFETVFIGGFGSIDVFATTVSVSFGSIIFGAATVVVAAADTTEMAPNAGIDICTHVVAGFTFTLAIDMVLVLL